MAITTAPSDEACQAIVDRINSGSGVTYTLPSAAEYFYEKSDDVQRLANLKVDVISLEEVDLNDTLDIETCTSHKLEVWIRKHVPGPITTAEIAAIKLIARQIWRRVNDYATADRRVRVWEAGADAGDDPNKATVRQGVISIMIPLRITVEPSP